MATQIPGHTVALSTWSLNVCSAWAEVLGKAGTGDLAAAGAGRSLSPCKPVWVPSSQAESGSSSLSLCLRGPLSSHAGLSSLCRAPGLGCPVGVGPAHSPGLLSTDEISLALPIYSGGKGPAVVQSLRWVDSLGPHGLQHGRLPCPPLSPGVCSDSCLLNSYYYLAISSSSCLQSFPASGSFPVSQLFASGGPKYLSFSISPSNEHWDLYPL